MRFGDLFRPPSPSHRLEPRIEFLGEQDGDVERDLKAALIGLFARFPSVRRAYLARVGFQPATAPSIAICLALEHPNQRIVREICDAFRPMFSSDAFVDVLFLTPEQEIDAARVCSAFYARAV